MSGSLPPARAPPPSVPVPPPSPGHTTSEVHLLDEPNQEGPAAGTPFVVCFPSAGLASTIVAHHAIRHLKLPRVATVRSADLPSAAVIFDRRPNPPVRIHANPTVAVAVSEFPAPPTLMLPLAEAFLDWARSKKLGPVIVVEGVVRKERDGEGERRSDTQDVMGIAAIPESEALLNQAKVPILIEGIVGGLTAELLNLGTILRHPVSVIFVPTVDPSYPDYRAAARFVEILDRVIPGLALDPAPMLEQAEVLEKMLKEAMKVGKMPSAPKVDVPAEPGGTDSSMYG